MKYKYKHTLEVTTYVTVETDLGYQEMIDEFGSECSYEFPSTDNVKVTKLEWIDTELVD